MPNHHAFDHTGLQAKLRREEEDRCDKAAADRCAALQGSLLGALPIVVRAAPVEQWNKWLSVPLEYAAAAGNLPAVQGLIAAGARSRAGYKGLRNRSLVHAAAFGGSVEVLAAVLTAGSQEDVDARGDGRTPLLCAAWEGHQEMVSALIAEGADPRFADGKGFTALHLASLRGHVGIVQNLTSIDIVDKDAQTKEFTTAVSFAVSHDKPEVLRALLKAGASTKSPNPIFLEEKVPLYEAVKMDNRAIVRILIDAGADLERPSQNCYTPLSVAARTNNTAVIKTLVEAGADIEGKCKMTHTPLLFAAWSGHANATEKLLRRGANMHALVSGTGDTALHIAAGCLKVAVVEVLLRWGADGRAVNTVGKTALDVVGTYPLCVSYDDREEEKRRLDHSHGVPFLQAANVELPDAVYPYGGGYWTGREEIGECIKLMLKDAAMDRTWKRRRVVRMLAARIRELAKDQSPGMRSDTRIDTSKFGPDFVVANRSVMLAALGTNETPVLEAPLRAGWSRPLSRR